MEAGGHQDFDLQDLDLKSRAAISIVSEWQGPIGRCRQDDNSPVAARVLPVRAVWTLRAVYDLLSQTAIRAREILENCERIDHRRTVAEGGADDILELLGAFAEMAARIHSAYCGFVSIVRLFESQGANWEHSSDDLQKSVDEAGALTDRARRLSELVEWESLNRQALSPSEFKQLAAYLLETGKASA